MDPQKSISSEAQYRVSSGWMQSKMVSSRHLLSDEVKLDKVGIWSGEVGNRVGI
jgi:hypothetical protein